jgi:hypothetical protein
LRRLASRPAASAAPAGCKTYALPMDMWAVGLIIAEMAMPNKKALFAGNYELADTFYAVLNF